MEIDQQINDISNAIEAFSVLAPGQAEFVNFTKEALAREILRGPRKTYLKRLQSEMVVYAKNVLSTEKYASFKTAISKTSVNAVAEKVLLRIIERGGVNSDAEFRLAMDEINSLLQESGGQSEEVQAMVAAANRHLAEYEQRMKR